MKSLIILKRSNLIPHTYFRLDLKRTGTYNQPWAHNVLLLLPQDGAHNLTTNAKRGPR